MGMSKTKKVSIGIALLVLCVVGGLVVRLPIGAALHPLEVGREAPTELGANIHREEMGMSQTKKVLIGGIALLVLCVLGVVGGLVGGIINIGLPTQGKKIEHYETPQKALLVIDIQEDFTGTTARPPYPFKNSEQLIATVNRVIEEASKQKIIIVYIRQEFDGLRDTLISGMLSTLFSGKISAGTAIKGNPGTEIDKRITILSDYVFPKPRGDAFSNPKLDALLIEQQVNELYLVGLDAEYCVHVTAKGALNRGYAVNIITDAIALRAEEKWEGLLQQYREEGITLLTSQQFLEQTP
jgi:nicotinamidase/pyrazinamidase